MRVDEEEIKESSNVQAEASHDLETDIVQKGSPLRKFLFDLDYSELPVEIDRSCQGIDRFHFKTKIRHQSNGEIIEERHGTIPEDLFTTIQEKRASKVIHDQTLQRIDEAIMTNNRRLQKTPNYFGADSKQRTRQRY